MNQKIKDTITDPTIGLVDNTFKDSFKDSFNSAQFFESTDWNQIDKDSVTEAMQLVIDLYKSFFGAPPTDTELIELNTSLGHEIENLRILIKMRKSDEQIHNMNVLSLTVEPGNAPLYRSLAQTQKSLLDIQKQTDETIKNIKAYFERSLDTTIQQPLEKDSGEEADGAQKKFKGSKSFIASLQNSNPISNKEVPELTLF